MGSSAPCPAFFRPSGLRSAPPPPVSKGRPEGSLPRARMPFPLHPGTRHCSGALPCCRPALAPASPPTCSHPQSRGRVGTGSATLTLLLLTTTCCHPHHHLRLRESRRLWLFLCSTNIHRVPTVCQALYKALAPGRLGQTQSLPSQTSFQECRGVCVHASPSGTGSGGSFS